ncbi:MAG: phosphoribosylglycinamide synthetase C domain-containing protein, partial [Gemmatimonadales bacterium]
VSEGLTECLETVARGGRPPTPHYHDSAASVSTVLASRGYPDRPEQGAVITLPDEPPEGVTIFHAGTVRDDDGRLRVAGGRVLNVTAVGTSFTQAQAQSRAAAEQIGFEGKVFRRDIGWRETGRR